MKPCTHLEADPTLIGVPIKLAEGSAVATLDTTQAMIVDARGLVHGGFIFGLADYAAMLAVNDPNVVLGAAKVRFTKPVMRGDHVTAHAHVVESGGRKREVHVEAKIGSAQVFEGTFTCFVLEHHVLDTPRRP